jgi:uncharacterized protein with PIN domain
VSAVEVWLRRYAELNDPLPPSRRQRDNPVTLAPPATLADLIEVAGIPPGAIELALVNGRPSSLDRPLQAGDRVSLYPMFEAMDVTALERLRSRPLRHVRFVADAHLGALARYLRLLGFDTRFENDPGDEALAEISAREHRILLSRDRALLDRRRVTHGLRVPHTRPREQLSWVVERLDLYRLLRPFTRCMPCNGLFEPVSAAQVADRVPERVLDAFDRFWRCRDCGRIYWRGSHYDRLKASVDRLRIPPRPLPGLVAEKRPGAASPRTDEA